MSEQHKPVVFETVGLCRDYRVGRASVLSRLRGKPADTFRAVDDVSLKVRKGEVLAVVGGSGSGKSTLAKMLLGLLTPSAGSVLLDGRDVSTLARRDFGARVQPVFQDPYSSLNPRRRIGEILAQPLRLHSTQSPAEIRDRVAGMLDQVGLSPRYMQAFPNQMSGGQRQRVTIARALISNPEVLICDEPTSALDVSVQAQILNLLQDLRDRYDLTFVFITHNLAVVRHMASHVAVMHHGRVVENRPAEALFMAPEDDYTRQLLDSAPRIRPAHELPGHAAAPVFSYRAVSDTKAH
ncbi:ABC transporter ATP-binding protein [Salipiger abyssi]|uniref:ABC transporter ATP-binding protein n=1 Tax=Salipiger abyssi TaxID=1250539 RepID=UPI001A8D30E5|nr:ATP-binding cassette domain-containing protein [Salipiger abyssi]MBN9887187.1 ABC transporter ATP-binding protein [Salipiger abyssi]